MNLSNELDGVELELIEEYFTKGESESLPEELIRYLDLMQLMAGRLLRWDTGTRKNHINFFASEPYKLTKYKAEQLYHNTIEFFYIEKETSLEAFGNYYAQRLESLANATVQMATDEKALKVAGQLLKDAMEMRARYRPAEAAYPEELFGKKTVIYSDNKKLMGEESQDRREIARLIDSWEVPEKERLRLRSEAGIDKPKLILDVSNRPTKAE
jgi:hypothetical protein